MAIHCEPVSEQTNPSASRETRWIAASLAPLTPRNDKQCVVNDMHKKPLPILSSRGLKARGEPMVLNNRKNIPKAYYHFRRFIVSESWDQYNLSYTVGGEEREYEFYKTSEK